MVYRRKDRPEEGYRVWPTLPEPWGRVGPWQTGLKSKRQAEQVDAWLQEMALTRPELVDALTQKRFTLRTAWVAKLRGTLDALLVGINDPLITDAVKAYKLKCTDARAQSGLDKLLEYAAPGVRLSWLAGQNITAIYDRALAAGRKPNSVRRSLHRAIVELLVDRLGEDARAKAYRDVTVPGGRDDRDVLVVAAEIRKLLDACRPEQFRWMVVAAIATAVDRGPLLLMTPRHVDEGQGLAHIPDRKTAYRVRLLRLPEVALMAFRIAALGKELDERLWSWTPSQVRHMWESARAEAGLKHLRFKDLRHLLPTLLAEMGVDRKEIQSIMGHAPGSKQTDRYITPAGRTDVLNQAMARLGLEGANLRAVGE